MDTPKIGSEFLLYQTEDGQTKIEVRITDETVWLSLQQMAELFQRDKSVISRHIQNVYAEEELHPEGTVAKFATVQLEGEREVKREIEYYNLDVIISVGYRVKSHRGTQFRIWATQRLKEYIIKGFTMDDERLKHAGSGNYFDELLARIRDIRSSEKVFYRKILEIYATSIDYDPHTEITRQFFATIQNKMHWATHGQTAAELIYERADAIQPNMGLTNWKQPRIRREDVSIAKNYLTREELVTLNRIVSLYLDFAELQAENRKVMYMKDWIAKLDDFLRFNERKILDHSGLISHEAAITKALQKFEKYKLYQDEELSPVEKDFEKVISEVRQIEKKT